MSGWVKLTKQFTNDELWFNVTAFRLYVWILLKAAYADGIVLNGMKLKKGQYVSAYSQLGEDLMYIEGRAKKALAKSTVKRAVDKLVKKGLLMAEETSLGTLFTVVNSDDFKCLDGTGDFFCPPFRETDVEHSQNDNKTELEQNKRNQEFKNVRNNEQHPYPENWKNQSHERQRKTDNQKCLVSADDNAEEKEKRIERVASRFITLRNNGVSLNRKDELAIERICELPLKSEQLESLLEEVFCEHRRRNPLGKINSALYCEKVIMTILEAENNSKQPKKAKKESMTDRVERLIQEGKIILQEDSP